MFRPRIDAPSAKAETPAPQITASWIETNVAAPFFKSLITAFIVAVSVPYLGAQLRHIPDPLSALTTDSFLTWFMISLLGFWFIHGGGPIYMIDLIERAFGIDIDRRSDTHKRASNTGIGHILIEPWKGERAAELAARRTERIKMEKFIREAEKNSTTRHLDRMFRNQGDWHIWKDQLLAQGWIVIDEPGRKNSTWHLRLGAEETIIGALGGEAEDEHRGQSELDGSRR